LCLPGPGVAVWTPEEGAGVIDRKPPLPRCCLLFYTAGMLVLVVAVAWTMRLVVVVFSVVGAWMTVSGGVRACGGCGTFCAQ
jgi:hypothetical protein